MKTLAALLAVAACATLSRAEEAWRWTDANGTIHYTNRADAAPADATRVKTRLIVETTRLPGAPDLVLDGGDVLDAGARRAPHRVPPLPPPPRRAPRRIYTEERLGFDCYASDVLYAGGWAHPDDISVQGNCLPYLLGPEAWLNGARAELALREHGIDWRRVAEMYAAARTARTPRLASVGDAD